MADPLPLFERLGGAPALSLAVDLFYEKVSADPRLRPFFVGVDMARQRAHQRNFLTYAFGGAPGYAGRSLREAHRRLVEREGLTDIHFDIVACHLRATLAALRIDPALIAEVMTLVESARADVLNRADGPGRTDVITL